MIVKEKTSPRPNDKFGRTGYEAEIQMAFYLRRAFAENPEVLVFNDLRLERNGEAAQIDHLVVHRYGFVIVESKSVVGQLAVNARGEFMRLWDGKLRGMPSPIQQAKLQRNLLADLLNDHKEKLRRKVYFGLKQAYFGEERFRVLVAVSDTGVIKRQGIDPPELLKADSVVDAIKSAITNHAAASGVGGFVRAVTSNRAKSKQIVDDHVIALTDEEMDAIKRFLLARDTPLKVLPPASADSLATQTGAPGARTTADVEAMAIAAIALPKAVSCKHCSGDNLAIVYGRYGYYYKCLDCQRNTPIDQTCSTCGQKARISKSGLDFRRICTSCRTEVHFHTNPARPRH